MYVNAKMIPVETSRNGGKRRVKENGGGVNSSMKCLTYCKNLCNCHCVHYVAP
jgi:hypothetical protein